MAQVHKNSMVAHLWANQSQANARSHNGNMSYEGRTLYSYGTPIAKLCEGADGRLVALITSHSYSVTTNGKHIRPAFRAVGYKAFRVPSLGAGDVGRHHEPATLDHSDTYKVNHGANQAHLAAGYEEARARAMRSRDGNAWVIETMRNAAAVAVNYAAAFGLPIPVFDTEADIRAAWAARSTPEARAKREAANAKAKARREAKELEERRLASIAWVEGGTKRPPYGGPVLLRVQGDTLETSMGARVPLADAIRVFRAVAACRAKGVGWKRNGETLPVGHFQVDLIAPSGDFVAGCHRIGWPEVERLAGKLGLL